VKRAAVHRPTLGYAFKAGPLPWLIAIAAGGFVVTTSTDELFRLPPICGFLGPAVLVDMAAVHNWSPAAMILAWLLMVTAMMPPLLAQPVGHIWVSIFKVRRPRALALFGFGYAAVWLAAGGVLVPAAVALHVLAPETSASLTSLALAFIWSSSPAAQVARNRCHRVRRISAFGTAADRDCFLQGLMSGASCTATCWPWMLAPMTMGSLHLVAMAAITYLLFLERIAPPKRPVWQFPPSLKMLSALANRQKVIASSF
jgi:predicted metal-binding membrane protein